jgi:hypothetical protein
MRTITIAATLLMSLIVGPLNAASPSAATPTPAAGAPLRIVFKAYDGDPKQSDDFKKFSFQIDTIDLKQPSEFLQLGQMIPGTKFKLSQFVFKEVRDARSSDEKDVSELMIVNVVTGKTAVLILNKVVDVSAIGPERANK